VPWGWLSLWKWVPGISPGVKTAGAYGWRPTTLVVPDVKKIWGLDLPGTRWATSTCCGMTFTYIKLFSVKRTLKKLITLAIPPFPYWWKVEVRVTRLWKWRWCCDPCHQVLDLLILLLTSFTCWVITGLQFLKICTSAKHFFFFNFYDIFVNCNWVVTWWQKYNTHLRTNNT